MPLVLASSSPRRRRILEGLDLEFVVEPPGTDENVDAGETPEDHIVRLAGMKAAEVARRYAEGTILGADTIVVVDGVMLGKPSDPPDAVRMLNAISGRWHEVLTGLAVVRCSDGATVRGLERTKVLVRELSDSEIEGYVAGGEPLDKAGSYAIQECGAAVVSRVDGCFYNVVGLPVVRLGLLLKELRGEAR
ncbi:MAG: septum formation protein Maf [Candidatus Eisenbacteria sp.]|nr:septum formation protein Maf [Candidatus Eisenbacteria bacterium]